MPNPLEDLQTHLWVFAALGRLGREGMLEAAAPADDPLALASQRLLIEAGWLESTPVRPSPMLLSAVPPGLGLNDALPFYVADLLNLIQRYALGDSPGWRQRDPDIIRSYGRASGNIVATAFTRAFSELDEFPTDSPNPASLPRCGRWRRRHQHRDVPHLQPAAGSGAGHQPHLNSHRP